MENSFQVSEMARNHKSNWKKKILGLIFVTGKIQEYSVKTYQLTAETQFPSSL